MEAEFTSSIVLYNNNVSILRDTISSVLNTDLNMVLYLVDNSPKDDLKKVVTDHRIQYHHNPTNPGFGAAHNYAIQKAIEIDSKFHFIINPDVHFGKDVIPSMIHYMKSDPSVGMMMPEILNLDGTIQTLPKLLPNPWSIVLRKLKRPKAVYEKFIDRYELRQAPSKMVYNVPVLSGCFTLLNLEAIVKVDMYDDRFFMYFEDWDLSRRMHQKYKTIYYPLVSVYHGYASEANKSTKIFMIFIKSAVRYFNKWGWFFDTDRNEINKKIFNQFQ